MSAEQCKSVDWVGGLDGYIQLIDQTLLPQELRLLQIRDAEAVWEAIKQLRVRGAPAIGIAAAMGLVLAVRDHAEDDWDRFAAAVEKAADDLASSRPTAVNLFWALDRCRHIVRDDPTHDVAAAKQALLEEAQAIRAEDAAMCRAIGEAGLELLPDNSRVLTHCNAGGLATAELGTALAPIFLAHAAGRRVRVYADETRPLLQGARLTAWELSRAGVDVTVLCDNMAGQLMQQGEVDLVITGADRIVANGDAANKIGTYSLAVLADAHDIPFYIAAPSSTFDLATASGENIPIEQRSPVEVSQGFGVQTVPDNVKCHCPAFDVTPARLIRAIVTERGIIRPVNATTVAAHLGSA